MILQPAFTFLALVGHKAVYKSFWRAKKKSKKEINQSYSLRTPCKSAEKEIKEKENSSFLQTS